MIVNTIKSLQITIPIERSVADWAIFCVFENEDFKKIDRANDFEVNELDKRVVQFTKEGRALSGHFSFNIQGRKVTSNDIAITTWWCPQGSDGAFLLADESDVDSTTSTTTSTAAGTTTSTVNVTSSSTLTIGHEPEPEEEEVKPTEGETEVTAGTTTTSTGTSVTPEPENEQESSDDQIPSPDGVGHCFAGVQANIEGCYFSELSTDSIIDERNSKYRFNAVNIIPLPEYELSDWSILLAFDQRVNDFQSDYDSYRTREGGNTRWIMAPKKDQTLGGSSEELTMSISGRIMSDSLRIGAWWCPGVIAGYAAGCSEDDNPPVVEPSEEPEEDCSAWPTFEPSDSSCVEMPSSDLTETEHDKSGRNIELVGESSVTLDADYLDWTILVDFSGRIKSFDSDFDSIRKRDQNEPIQQRWILSPKKKQVLTSGDFRMSINGWSDVTGNQYKAWFCAGSSEIEFQQKVCDDASSSTTAAAPASTTTISAPATTSTTSTTTTNPTTTSTSTTTNTTTTTTTTSTTTSTTTTTTTTTTTPEPTEPPSYCETFAEGQICDAEWQTMLEESEAKLVDWMKANYPKVTKNDANSVLAQTMGRKWRLMTSSYVAWWNGEKGNPKCIDKAPILCSDVCFDDDWTPCQFLSHIDTFIAVSLLFDPLNDQE